MLLEVGVSVTCYLTSFSFVCCRFLRPVFLSEGQARTPPGLSVLLHPRMVILRMSMSALLVHIQLSLLPTPKSSLLNPRKRGSCLCSFSTSARFFWVRCTKIREIGRTVRTSRKVWLLTTCGEIVMTDSSGW